MSVTVQYIIVGAILLGSLIWITVRLKKGKRGNDAGCSGCGLYETCRRSRSLKQGCNGHLT